MKCESAIRGQLKHTYSINSRSDKVPNAVYYIETILMTIFKHLLAVSKDILNLNPNSISKSTSNYSHSSLLLLEAWLLQQHCDAVGKCLSSQYVAQNYLSTTIYICRKIIVGCDVSTSSCVAVCVLDARNQWL